MILAKTLALALILSSNFAHAALSNSEVESLFDGDQHCTKSGVHFNFSFYDMDKKHQELAKPYITKEQTGPGLTSRECIQVPAGLSGAVMEKDECDTFVIVYPNKLEKAEAQYVFSRIHANPNNSLLKPAFNTALNPVSVDKEKWDKLAADYALIRKANAEGENKKASELLKKYTAQYAILRKNYLAEKNLRTDDIHIAEIAAAGCE